MFAFITVAVALLTLAFSAAAQESCRTPSGKPCVLVEQAAVTQAQGLEFLGINYSTNIGDVLAGVYRFALGLVGIAALIMFVLGGVTYMTAADSQDRVKQGQTFMRNAVFGLALALLSYLILFTINPDIVQRLELDLVKIKEAKISIVTLQDEETRRVIKENLAVQAKLQDHKPAFGETALSRKHTDFGLLPLAEQVRIQQGFRKECEKILKEAKEKFPADLGGKQAWVLQTTPYRTPDIIFTCHFR